MPRFTAASRGGKNTRKSRGHADGSACFVRIEPIDVCAADTTRCYGRRQPPRLPHTTTPSPLAPLSILPVVLLFFSAPGVLKSSGSATYAAVGVFTVTART